LCKGVKKNRINLNFNVNSDRHKHASENQKNAYKVKKKKGAGRGTLTASGGTERLIRSYDHDASIIYGVKALGLHT